MSIGVVSKRSVPPQFGGDRTIGQTKADIRDSPKCSMELSASRASDIPTAQSAKVHPYLSKRFEELQPVVVDPNQPKSLAPS